jgi:hypothetical protein
MNYDARISACIAAYNAGTKDYASTLQDMIEVYSIGASMTEPLVPLLSLLGCTTVKFVGGEAGFLVNEPLQPDAIHEGLVSSRLLDVLRLHTAFGGLWESTGNGLAILNGLSRKDRWASCLDSKVAASDLATLLLAQSPELSIDYGYIKPWGAFLEESADSLYTIANAWLKPDPGFTKATPLPTMACAMFGNIWYDLTFGGKAWFDRPITNDLNNQNEEIAESVRRDPPPLMPHLLNPGVDERTGMELPDLVTSTSQ